ncbi:MAG: hypothetical protein M5R36_03050 [Deltaproteobacteria bacterium]|nr:hypothetical protein [Deltaproteobacteria bacterium]
MLTTTWTTTRTTIPPLDILTHEAVDGSVAGYDGTAIAALPDGRVVIAVAKLGDIVLLYQDTNGVSEEAVVGAAARPRLRADASGGLHLAFENQLRRNIGYATNASGSWIVRDVNAPGGRGREPELELDGSGNAHLLWNDQVGSTLVYSTLRGETWEPFNLPGPSRAERRSLAMDPSGYPHVA